ncbi:MAG: hemolysin family protein [Prevotella sp.]|nr:hemolysin family protein [Prevotella sp.]
MDSDGYPRSWIIGWTVLAVILIYKSFCTVCESAVTETDRRKLRSGEKSKRRLLLADMTEKPARLMTAFSVNRTLTGVSAAYLAMFLLFTPAARISRLLVGGELSCGGFVSAANPAADIIAAIAVLLLTVTVFTAFCEGVPKRLPAAKSERFAVFCAPFVKFLVTALTPLTALSSFLVRLVSPLFGAKGSPERDIVTEEEILMMVDAGNETGVIEESQREMINNVFEFDDLTLSDIMTHRTDITAVEMSAKVSEVVNAAISSGFSRIPVYEETIDHIAGMICVKDLLCLVGSESAEETEAKSFMRDIIYLPESVPCGEAFKRLTSEKMQMAAVADEYGGTAGLVTMEDIVERIVGNIQDEYDEEEAEITKISEDTYVIAGDADPEEILPVFGIELPEENGFDTMNGFIAELLGRLPEENENPSVEHCGVLFTVLLTEDRCITKIKAKIIKDDTTSEEKESMQNEEKN